MSCLNLLRGVHHHLSVELLEIAYGNKEKRVCSICDEGPFFYDLVCSNQAAASLQQRICAAIYTFVDLWVSFGNLQSQDESLKMTNAKCTASNPFGISSGTLSGWVLVKMAERPESSFMHGPYHRLKLLGTWFWSQVPRSHIPYLIHCLADAKVSLEVHPTIEITPWSLVFTYI